VKLPSDFKGLTPLAYAQPKPGEDPSTALGPVIYQIKRRLRELGVRKTILGEK
jgi:CRP/FNR family transcriptional regulator, cyclic AMP receptor protein